ncbi:nuclear transport factor 2 family protein [Novosphingobium sp. B 225]|uniref:nuclear transport factor 2 family protein n=1 Tax=Novosphingobium sp. B 225 TaxID=1961849 RepID=UPI000B4B3F26|nr:nuclear transport factor 2 family protein [Novosphingobium sp. B 225]
MSDAEALRRCADLYAQGADRKDKALWNAVLADDCVIEGPGFSISGREANLGSIDMLGQMFRATQHRVHQVVATVAGDQASGETYCTADHLLKDQDAVLSWAIRYQDSWRRVAGEWRFTHRTLIVDWEEVCPVTPKAVG